MKTVKIVALLAVASLCGVLVSSVRAALAITSSDVVDSAYTYSLVNNSGSLVSSFNNDVYSKSHVGAYNEGGSSYTSYISPQSPNSASFEYKFDFSSLGYSVVSVTFTDKLSNFGSPNIVSMVTEYSIDDGVTWHTISSRGTSGATTGISGQTIALSSLPEYTGVVGTVLYQVIYTDTTGGAYTTNQYQWGRTTTGGTAFTAAFSLESTAIPEPATWTLLSGACVLVFVVTRCRLRRQGGA